RSETSATRKSRSDLEAWFTAAAAAFSHESELVPTSSITLYTLSAMGFSFGLGMASILNTSLWEARFRRRVQLLPLECSGGLLCRPQGEKKCKDVRWGTAI